MWKGIDRSRPIPTTLAPDENYFYRTFRANLRNGLKPFPTYSPSSGLAFSIHPRGGDAGERTSNQLRKSKKLKLNLK